MAVQDGSLHFLFENKGLVYDGKGFEMLAALNQHCHPNLVANSFMTLLLLFNDSAGVSDEIMAFRSRFDGMVNNMACCKIFLPLILIVMFFLRSLHSCYNDLLEQFFSHYKSLEGTSLDLIVADVRYQEEFQLVGMDKKLPAAKTPKVAAAAASSLGNTILVKLELWELVIIFNNNFYSATNLCLRYASAKCGR